MQLPDGKNRCFGTRPGQELLAEYHDQEWGIPVYDDQVLFEMLTLEGAQAGLSWEVVLKKRKGYQRAFHNFDLEKVAMMPDDALEALRSDPEIVRNRLKIYSTRSNAAAILEIQAEYGSFADYLWEFVAHQPVINHFATHADVPASTPLSDRISKDMKKRGLRFVGTTIIYAYIQGVGLVNDHTADCWCVSQPERTGG